MYAVGVRVNVCTVGHVSAQAIQRFLRSLAVLWSHWLPTGPAGMAGPSMVSVTSFGSSWLSSSFTLEHWLQNFKPLVFLSFLEVGDFWEAFLATFSWMCLFTLTVTLATLTLLLDLGWQEVFIFSSWVSGVACSITALELCDVSVTLVILKALCGLLQSPWAPLYIPLPRGHTLMKSASHFASQWWPWVSLDIT